MTAKEYRQIVRVIVKNVLRKEFPGLKKPDAVIDLIAKNIHARLYGANVDGVDSPLWLPEIKPNFPNVDAQTLLERID